MFIREIQIPISRVGGVGPATAKILQNLGIHTVGDILLWWPRDWDDRTKKVSLAHHNEVAKINTHAVVIGHEWFGYGRMKTLKIIIEDDEGTQAELACFNRPFLEKSFPVGSNVAINGSFHVKYGSLQSSAFEIEHIQDAPAKILPVYSLTAGITQMQMRKIIASALREYAKGIDSELPEKVRLAAGISEKKDILFTMHNPSTLDEAQKALNALIFEEFFLFQYAIGQRSLKRRGRLPNLVDTASQKDEGTKNDTGKPHVSVSALQNRLIERLPFRLTDDQYTVLDEINKNIDGPHLMARLLQGDVGSGKTLVAFLACLKIIENKGQCAFLAPTELLARQHAENAAKLLEPTGVRLAFLTGNIKASGRSKLLAELEAGNIDLIIGTHALFSAGVTYSNLRLAIIDEQHRFGVLQRAAIIAKGKKTSSDTEPHLLMMSATPIPRTLALSVFGDLDISVIRTMPPNRKPIITHLARQGNEKKVYDFVRRELKAGHQSYFVYPLIEHSEDLSLKSAQEMYEKLATEIFPEYQCALIHSKVPENEQRSIMAQFHSSEIQILVATSVVEVGVDVANATCMVIEHAERFGLSALHQMRGRVGRSELQSWCFLVYSGNLTEDGKARMKIMHETNDGFIIAEEDLTLRGPGEITGIQQSGYLAFNLADPVRDRAILEEARTAAFTLLLEKNVKI